MLNTLWMTTRWAIVPSIISILFTSLLWPDLYWDNELFHVLIEAGGALVGFALAYILLAMIQKQQLSSNHIWLIACFISMGIMDLFHSLQHPGQAFVWLHTLATFSGGSFAMLIWIPASSSRQFIKQAYFWLIVFLSTGLAGASLLWPESLPQMLDANQQFTLTANILNLLGGTGFIITWLYFARQYHQTHQPKSFYFSNHFCLFAIAGLIFEFSALWDGNWWFWHTMRAFAYLYLLFHFSSTYQQSLLSSAEENETRYKALIDSSPDWIWEIDANGVYTYASPKAYDLIGYRPEELIGKTPFELMPPAEAEEIAGVFSIIARDKRAFYNLENINIHKNGQTVVLETSGVPILSETGELKGFRGIDRDITQRNLTETELRLQRDFNNTILDAAANVIVVFDQDGNFVRFNRAAEELTGYSSYDVRGKPFWETVIPEEQMEGVNNVFINLKKGNLSLAGEYENEWITRDKSRRLLHWHNSVLHDNNGNISHIISLGYDITEQKQAEKNTYVYKKNCNRPIKWSL